MDKLISIPFLVFFPMIMSFFILSPLFTNNEISVRRFSKGIFGFIFLYTTAMLLFFSSANPYVNQIHFFGTDWIQSLGITFSFKVDNISMIMVVLTSFIFLIASIASKMNIRKNNKFYYSMLLLLLSAVFGIFTANDMFVFFLFWELELIPAYFLIGGDYTSQPEPNAKKSAVKFVLFTFLGSMFMLLGILLVHYYNYVASGTLSASFGNIIDGYIPTTIQLIIAICFLIGFGVKLPIIPLHTWLPDAHTNAPTPVSIILAGILLKTGAYGIYKFNYEMMSESFKIIAPILAILAVINIIYTAFVAYAQTDIKRIVAYSSISNMGLILLGLVSCNQIGLSASFFHIIAHALVTAGLFMICGIVYLRCKTRNINSLGGIAIYMPRLFGFATLIVLASIGVPAFAPFISEILTIIGALASEFSIIVKFIALISLPLLIISSCYMLKFLHRSFLSDQEDIYAKINDISIHEFVVLASVVIGLLILGIFPSVILNLVGALQ